jgi:two-component system, chemotaxis family, protein-glutamate methylesterase/glutaminase
LLVITLETARIPQARCVPRSEAEMSTNEHEPFAATASAPRPRTAKSPARILVAIAASADGVEALVTVLKGLPGDLPAAVAIVQHRTTALPDDLVRVLLRATALPVKVAEEGEPLSGSSIYVAPPDAHLTVMADGSVRIVDGNRIRHVLSSANRLFESAPDAFGRKVIAVALTGCNQDATDGVQRVAEAGGCVLAEESAAHSRMPRSLTVKGAAHELVPRSAIARRIVELVQARAPAK